MYDIQSISTINSVVVSLDPSITERRTSSGVYVVEEERPYNYGFVEVLPTFTTQEYSDYAKIFLNLKVGDVVFFNPKHTYTTIELKDNPNKKYLIIPLEMIFAFYAR